MGTPAAAVDIRLFGHAGLTVNGLPVKLPKRTTTLSLLAYLILQRGKAVARTALAYVLFPDEAEETAHAELRRYLYLTGKALPALDEQTWFAIDGDTVRWNDSVPCSIDVVEFERGLLDATTRPAAVDLYQGDLLEEIYDDWVVAERERLRGLYFDALAELLSSHRERREFARSLAYAQRLLALDPWREDIVRSALAVRYESGDTAGALAEFTRFAQRLRDELNVGPMPETVAVRDAIARGETLPGAVIDRDAAATSPALRAPPLLPFVGRGRELAALEGHWTRAARGSGLLVLVDGEAGVGKTRLAAELSRRAEAQGGRVLVGGSSSPESIPYQPIVEALRSALALLVARRLAPPTTAVLARILPELHDSSQRLPEVAPVSAERETTRLLDALADSVLGLSHPRPAVLVLEDLHWAGNATLDAIAVLARRLEGSPLLVVGTYRSEEVGPGHALRALVRQLVAEHRVATLSLERFGHDEVADLVSRLDGIGAAVGTVVDRLYAYTEGNPLFLNEAIADARERHGGALPQSLESTAGIAAVIASRTDRLSEAARTVVETAAVCGRGCTLEVVRDVVALSPAALSEAFNELLDRRILRDASARSGVDFAFTHELIGASIYQRIDAPLRAKRHGRIAHIMRQAYAERTDAVARELAVHFDRGGIASDAAHFYAIAARASASVYAGEEAIALATRALELESNPAKRVDMLRLREELRGRSGDRSGQKADIDSLEAALANGDDDAHFDLLRRRMLLARNLGETDEERTFVERMTGLARTTADKRVRAEALRHHAAHAVLLSRQAEAMKPAAEALALFEALGDVAAQVECLGLLVNASTNAGDLVAARRYLDGMRERASSLGDRAVQARALTIAATAALLRQQYAEAQELTREVLTISESLGDRDAEAFARARIGATAAWLGDFTLAFAEFDRALDLFAALDNKRGLATTLTNKVLLAMRLGLFEEAQALIERSNALLDVVQERRTAVANAVNLSFIRLQLGDGLSAKRLAAEGLDQARSIGFPMFEAAALANLGNAERELGNLDAAITHMEAGLAIRRGLQEPADFADDLADLTLAYASAGRTSEALSSSQELAVLLQAPASGPLWPHYIAWAAAKGFQAAGDGARAALLAERARAELAAFAGTIHDPTIRRAFLSTKVNRQIAYEP